MNVLFRTDASVALGRGHVLRCLTLADAVRAQGGAARFICRQYRGNLIPSIKALGHEVRALPDAQEDVRYAEWQDPEWERDAEQTMAALAEQPAPADWLIVDSYALGAPWEAKLRATAKRIMAIDDLGNRDHNCDVLVDHNFHSDPHVRYAKLCPADCLRLLGPRYALLRPEFRAKRSAAKERDGHIRSIAIFLGGDPNNVTARIVEAIAPVVRAGVRIDVIVGSAVSHRQILGSLGAQFEQIKVHTGDQDMASLYAAADLAIGAAGVSTWERCCLGLPSIVIAIAQNQEPSATALARDGRIVYLGTSAEATNAKIAEATKALLEQPARVRQLSRACAELVDGKGAERVMLALDTKTISLRKAQSNDCDSIYIWRNAEQTRRFSRQPDPIRREDHERWFSRLLADTGRVMLIGELAGEAVGVLRYDANGSRCVVSIYLVPGKSGHGYGARLLLAGHEWLRRHRPDIEVIVADVLPENRPSAEAFRQAGYALDRRQFLARIR